MHKGFLFFRVLLFSVALLLANQAYASAVHELVLLTTTNSDGSLFTPDAQVSVSTETSLIWQDMQHNWQLFLQKLPMIGLGLHYLF
jgi:hypothetical protein